jgi:hypothetical protein
MKIKAFTSDLHFHHKAIISFCNRPFYSVDHMNETLIENYNRIAKGKKALVFASSLESSQELVNEMVLQGMNAKHVDCYMNNREDVLEWFKNTDGAILSNYGILTTGFDEPTTEETNIAGDTGKVFHFRDTSKVDGSLGFWENADETYDNTADWDVKDSSGTITDSFKNEKIRHHKMPGPENIQQSVEIWETANLGLKISNIVLPDALRLPLESNITLSFIIGLLSLIRK